MCTKFGRRRRSSYMTEDLTRNGRAFLKATREPVQNCRYLSSISVSPKCTFRDEEKTVGIMLQSNKSRKLWKTCFYPKRGKKLMLSEFCAVLKKLLPNATWKSDWILRTSKNRQPNSDNNGVFDNFNAIMAAVKSACELTLRKPFPCKQFLWMANASFRAWEYALMMQHHLIKNLYQKSKNSPQSRLDPKFSIFPN